MAPPARQTKSAECAPITSRRRLATPDSAGPGKAARPPDDHLLHIVVAESRGEQPVGPEGETVLDRGVVRVPEVAREERTLDADGAHAVEDVLPRGLAAVRRRQAPLEQAAALGERSLVFDREVLTRKLRMRDDDLRDPFFERPLDDCERVV